MVAASLGASTPAAQETQTTNYTGLAVGLAVGVAIPVGTLRDTQGTGFRVDGHVGIAPALIPLGLRFDVGYDRLSGKHIGGESYGNASVWSGTLNGLLRLPIDANVYPYALLGLGLYSTKSYGGDQLQRRTKLGLDFGGGAVIPIGGVNTFLEAKFVNVFSGTVNASNGGVAARYLPITVGINFPIGS